MIGNKFNKDIMGAINIGMSAILVNSKLTSDEKEYLEENNIELDVVSNIGDIIELL
jgi:putative hydrolase of the HAD superfamily